MKEATGEVSMTMITLIAVGVIAAILAFLWPNIQGWIEGEFQQTINQDGNNNYNPSQNSGLNP